MAIATINPATGETVRVFDAHTPDDVELRVARSAARFAAWRRVPFAERRACLLAAGELLLSEKRHWGELMTLEMGKPIGAAMAEAEKCASVCRFYAEHAESYLADEVVETEAAKSFIAYQPMGVVLAVMPWNFPFWQVWRFAAPALMAGNVGLLKHASNVPQCALAIEEICRRAGFPEGCFETLLVGPEAVSGLIADPRIAAVTLTGSEGAGVAVGRAAGEQIKTAVLELGGSDPFVVMPTADLETAVATAVKARTINNGQSCIAAKRFIVHREIAERFVEGFVARMAALQVGDPMDPATEIGPLATPKIRAELHEQVEKSVAAGGKLLTGGVMPSGAGNFYPPTVILDPAPGTPADCDELFGPVASVFVVDSIDQAIHKANHPTFGLGASAWSRDPAEQERFIRELEAGSVSINGMVTSDPRLPFGGIKRSGFGRELSSQGIREFVNVKTVWVG